MHVFMMLLCFFGLAPGASYARPSRVVSINLCTDQLAMLIADKDQLLSVSHLAMDPTTSLMVDQAKQLTINHGKAEEIIRLRPDLVLAGIYTSNTTISLLRRLGVRVEQFAPDSGLDAIRKNIKRIGDVLEQPQRAARMVKDFDSRLLAIEKNAPAERKVMATYEPNSYTGGAGTLANEMIKVAGFRHLGEELGYVGSTVKLPLEDLIRYDPDYIMSWSQWSGSQTRATQILQHPALEEWFGTNRRIAVDTRYWICGGPFTADAIADLQRKVLQKEEENH